MNLYTYVHNNPLTNIDPTGNYCVSADGKNAHEGDCNTEGSINLGHDDKWIGHAVVENGELKRLVGVSGSDNYYKNYHVKMTLNVDNLREKGTVFNGDTSCSDCASLLPVSEDPIAQTILSVTPAGTTTRAAKAAEETAEFGYLQLFAKSSGKWPGGAMSGKDVVKFLKKEGFEEISQNGSHLKLKGPDGNIVIVPVHGNKSLPPGTLKSIKDMAGFGK